MIYTPIKGYRGPDSFKLGVSLPRYENDVAPKLQTASESFVVK